MVMVYSSSAIYAYERFGDSAYFLKRHMLFLLLGVIVACAVMTIDYQKIAPHAKLIYMLCLLGLALTLVPKIGFQAGGARRWIAIAGFKFQPAEIAKIGLIIYLADFFSRRKERVKNFFFGFLPPTFIILATCGIVLLQPDLGNAIVIALVGLIIYFASGINFNHILASCLAALPVFYFLIFSVEYRRRRMMAFLNPWLDPKGAGFQIIQSFLALGAGGLLGVGLGKSQQKLFYLPASHTDFIFSIIGEELGLLGALFVVALFIIFIWQGAKLSLKASDLFGKLLSLAIVSKIGLEAIINIGVTAGALPAKGLPLPFISYGGTALIVNMASVGLLLNIARRKHSKCLR